MCEEKRPRALRPITVLEAEVLALNKNCLGRAVPFLRCMQTTGAPDARLVLIPNMFFSPFIPSCTRSMSITLFDAETAANDLRCLHVPPGLNDASGPF
jgi:hypothetical protein